MKRCILFLVTAAVFLYGQVCVLGFSRVNEFEQQGNANDTIHAQSRISAVKITGNKKTRERVINRELTFKEGMLLDTADILGNVLKSRDNLMNTNLFNKVDIQIQDSINGVKLVNINLAERHYLYPLPLFEIANRNFNEWWEDKDFKRVTYGMTFIQSNFRGMNETIGFALRNGYNQQASVYYTIPYASRSMKAGLAFSTGFLRRKEITLRGANDHVVYFDSENFIRESFWSSVRYSYRTGFHNTHFVDAELKHNRVGDTVARVNPNYFLEGRTEQTYLYLGYKYVSDHRDIRGYPLKGYYSEFEVSQTGFPLMNQNIYLLALSSSVRYYQPLASNRVYFAGSMRGLVSGRSMQPFVNQRTLGYGNLFVRGYENYVVYGQDYYLAKSNLKYRFLSTEFVRIPRMLFLSKTGVPVDFYLNAFADSGYMNDRQSSEPAYAANRFLLGHGIGLDIVIYKMRVFRLDYALNQFGERGFFLHFVAPI
jgi:outer membrane protein assembly factor BamA